MHVRLKISLALGIKAMICSYCALWLLFVNFIGAAIAADAPVLFVAEPFLDAGQVPEGAPALLTFRLANRGTEPLTIKKVGHSAGCFVDAYVKKIAPDKTETIRTGIKTKGKTGKIKGTFFLYTNDPKSQRFQLRVAATVVPVISVVPDRVYFSGFADETYKTAIIIRTNVDQPLKIKSITCSVEDHVDYRITTIRAGKVYRLDMNAQPPPGSYFRGRLILESSYPEKPLIIIPVLGRILNDVEVIPSSLNFGVRFKKDYVKPSPEEKVRFKDWRENWSKLPKSVFLRVNRGKEVRITGSVLESPFFKKDCEVLRDGKLYKLTVLPIIDQMPPGKCKALLRINTNHGQFETFDIPIQVTVK